MIARCSAALLAASFLGLISPIVVVPTSAEARELRLHPRCQAVDERRNVTCDLRFSDPLTRPRVDKVTVLWAGTDTPETATFSEFDADSKGVAVLLLVDTSRSMIDKGKDGKDRTLAAMKSDIGRILAGARRQNAIGFAVFGDKFDILAPIGSSSSTLEDALGKVKFDGSSTAYYRDIQAAVETLADFKGAERRALVVMSDGVAEDPETEYLRAQVIETARNQGVVIYGIGYKNDKKPLEVGRLQRLADETDGPYVDTDTDRSMPRSFLDAFYGFMEFGVTAKFPLRAPAEAAATVAFDISTILTSGASVTSSVTLAERVAPGWLDWAFGKWYRLDWRMQAMYGGGLAAVLALLTIGLWMYRRSSRAADMPITQGALDDRSMTLGDPWEPTAEFEPAGGFSGPANQTAYAWLERLDTGERLGITKTAASVGRHDDNDIRLRDDSIHRRHANLHMTPHREFILTDLAPMGGNVVKVNGTPIGKEQRTLHDGDLVELGSVRMRFVVSTV
ncbi:MAG: FHA domain-containing protein [Hyphomicrobiaceae bacterium]|nr:FHA domain-containing protein [Hyphomicrobiaceae bacterium]